MSALIRCPSGRVLFGILDKFLQIQDFIQKNPCVYMKSSLAHRKSLSRPYESLAEQIPVAEYVDQRLHSYPCLGDCPAESCPLIDKPDVGSNPGQHFDGCDFQRHLPQ